MPRNKTQLGQQIYTVVFSDEPKSDITTLVNLYLPIIGSDGLALFLLLTETAKKNKSGKNQHAHEELFQYLSINEASFLTIRQKLEETGLLKKIQEKSEPATFFTYELQQVPTPNLFFSNENLVELLAASLGKQFVEKFRMEYSTSHITEKNKSNAGNYFEGTTPSLKTDYQTDIDYSQNNSDLLVDLLKNIGLETNEIKKHIDFFNQKMELFGISVFELFDVIKRTLLFTNQKMSIDEGQISKKLTQSFTNTKVNAPTTKNKKKLDDKLASPTFSNAESTLIKLSNEFSPVEFLKLLKEQRNGFVTKSEINIINRLMGMKLFPSSVINILIHYLIVVKKEPTLTSTLTDRIANSWSQSEISTAPQAVVAIKDIQKKAYNRRNKTSKKKEELPDYLNQSRTEQKKINTIDLQKELDQLENFKK